MKKISLFLLLILIFIPIEVFAAGSVTVSTRNLSITKGSTASFSIKANNAAGRIDISSSKESIASINKKSEWLDNSSITVTVTGVDTGSAKISVTLTNVATYDEETLNDTYVISVEVLNPPTPAPTPTPQPKPQPKPQPSPSQPVTKQPQTQAPRNVDVPTQPVTEPQTEAVTEETTTSMRDENSNGIDDEIEFESLKIVGYPIEFDPKINTYSIDIGSVNALYIISNPLTEGATIDNNGEVVIEGLDKIVLTLKYNEKSSNITINLNRTSNNINKEPTPKTDSKRIKFSTIVIIITGIITFALVTTGYIYKDELLKLTNSNKKNKKNKKNDENFLDKLKVYDPINFDDKKD